MVRDRMHTFSLSLTCSGFVRRRIAFLGLIGLVSLLTSCPTTPNEENQGIQVQTDQRQYTTTDSLVVTITNDSTAPFPLWLHCALYPDLIYQRQEDGSWSEQQQFWYVWSLCPSKQDSLLPHERYQVRLPADWFEGTGTFRFGLKQYYSRAFTIEKNAGRACDVQ